MIKVVKVRDRLKLYKNGRSLEMVALFDKGSGKSYLSSRAAEKIGFERYPEPRAVPLAVEGKEVIGYVPAVDIEIAGCLLPEKETVGVVKGLREDAIIGLNLIEAYGIILERDRITLKEYPPKTFLF